MLFFVTVNDLPLFFSNIQAWSVPEVLRPLYESSRVVAQKMTTAVSA